MSVISNKHMDIPAACKQMQFVIIIRREMLSTPSGSEQVCFVCMSLCVLLFPCVGYCCPSQTGNSFLFLSTTFFILSPSSLLSFYIR